MKKKILATTLTLILATTMTVPAFADGTAAAHPAGSGETGASSGAATMQANAQGGLTSVVGDDDELAGALDTDGANIDVWARVTKAATEKLYKLDLAWGAMTFEFVSTADTWDPVNHVYVGGTGAWTLDNYYPATEDDLTIANNEIEFTNHSNNGVAISPVFTVGANAFNEDTSGNDAVRGDFYMDPADARTVAQRLTNTATLEEDHTVLISQNFILPTADVYGTIENPTDATTNIAAGPRKGSAYFALCGTPDTGKEFNLQKVGSITVNFAPRDNVANVYAPYAG